MNPPRFEDDDQRWYTDTYLNLINQCDWIGLDYCNMFQSIAFESEGDFEIRYGRLYNKITHTFPMFIHGNGKTDMTKFYAL
jgi:lysyl hydroxylase/galactosyltransferase/glucosyltransferase/procollagen-lysine,2-oxoglutarate 5-dioxygenase